MGALTSPWNKETDARPESLKPVRLSPHAYCPGLNMCSHCCLCCLVVRQQSLPLFMQVDVTDWLEIGRLHSLQHGE